MIDLKSYKLKDIPAEREERLKLPAELFADPENRRFLILDTKDLEKLQSRIRRLENRDEIRKKAIVIAVKYGIELPDSFLYKWDDVVKSEQTVQDDDEDSSDHDSE